MQKTFCKFSHAYLFVKVNKYLSENLNVRNHFKCNSSAKIVEKEQVLINHMHAIHKNVPSIKPFVSENNFSSLNVNFTKIDEEESIYNESDVTEANTTHSDSNDDSFEDSRMKSSEEEIGEVDEYF